MVIIKTLKRPRIMPYGFYINPLYITRCFVWCVDEIGDCYIKNNAWMYKNRSYMSKRSGKNIGYGVFYFMNEEDATAFKLRWS